MKARGSSELKLRRAEYIRLLRTAPEDIDDQARAFLVSELNQGDFGTAVEILEHHPTLAPPDIATLLVERCPVPLSMTWLVHCAHGFAQALGPDRYREFVARLADRHAPGLRTEEKEDPASAMLRMLIRYVSGGARFNRIVEAEHQSPPVLGTRPLGLMLLGHSIHDDAECLAVLCESARTTPAQALRVWCAARRAGDSELEWAVRGLVLEQLYVPALREPGADASTRILLEVAWWVERASDDPGCLDDVLRCADLAHAEGAHWGALELCLPSCLRGRIAERALDAGDIVFGTESALRQRLASGSREAWEKFFAIEADLGRTRDLLREGVLPEAADDHFWAQFGIAWQRSQQFESEQLAMHRKALPVAVHGQPEEVQIHWLRSVAPDLFRALTTDELIDKVLSRPPCSESARLLLAALLEKPERLDDERIRPFAPTVAEWSHDLLPDVRHLELHKPVAVANFLLLHGPCGSEHVRQAVRETCQLQWSPAWLLDQPWFASIVNDGLREEIVRKLNELPVEFLLQVHDRHPSWVTQDQIKQSVLNPRRLPALDRFPEWLDDTLFERATRAKDSDELRQLMPRFRTHRYYRNRFIAVVQEHLLASPDVASARLMGDLLDSANAWDKYGSDLVYGLLACEHSGLLPAVLPSSQTSEPSTDGKPDKRTIKIHLAFARGFLRWAEDRLRADDPDAVERALFSIALLDPPPPFAVDLHKFGGLDHLRDAAKDWVAKIHGMVKRGGGREATMRGLWDALSEFQTGGEP